MDRVQDLLAEIRRRPGMYIGNRSAIRLHIFLQGWLYGKGLASDAEILRDFQKWVASRYKVTSSHSWADIIEFFSEGTVESFEKFYDLFDEFLAARNK